jgi:hypothetical protein
MDVQETQDRHAQPDAHRHATTRQRAADARLRRAIRDAFARQRGQLAEPPGTGRAKRRLHAVGDGPAAAAGEREPDQPGG